MHRVLPSEAATIIGEAFDWVTVPRGTASVKLDQIVRLGAVVAAIEGIPEDLLPTGKDRTRIITALGAMRAALARWARGGPEGHSVPLDHMGAIGGHPLTV